MIKMKRIISLLTITLSLIFACTAFAIEVRSSNYVTINEALTAAANGKLIVDNPKTLISSLYVPRTTELEFINGGSFTKASTYTVTINGPFTAPRSQIFYGFSLGEIDFGWSPLASIFPEWWGAKTDGTISTQAMQCAFSNSRQVDIGKWTYLVDDTITVNADFFSIHGDQYRQSIIKMVPGINKDLFVVNSSTIDIDRVRTSMQGNTSGRAFVFTRPSQGTVKDLYTNDSGSMGVDITGGMGLRFWGGWIDGAKISGGYGLHNFADTIITATNSPRTILEIGAGTNCQFTNTHIEVGGNMTGATKIVYIHDGSSHKFIGGIITAQNVTGTMVDALVEIKNARQITLNTVHINAGSGVYSQVLLKHDNGNDTFKGWHKIVNSWLYGPGGITEDGSNFNIIEGNWFLDTTGVFFNRYGVNTIFKDNHCMTSYTSLLDCDL